MIFIGEAAKLSGASIKAIRHYEKIGLLTHLARSGSYRIFSESDVERIKLIKEARHVGLKLSELKHVFQSDEQWSWPAINKLIKQKQAEISKEIELLKIKQSQLNQYSKLVTDCLELNPDCSQTSVKHADHLQS